MKKSKLLLKLFLDFMRISCFTFGGGWSIVAQMQQQFVEKDKYITDQELVDMTSVGRSLPGAMVTNLSMLFGYHMAGYAGGAVSALGIALPPLAILAVITYFYTEFINSQFVAAAMQGIRAAVVPIIICAVLKMLKGAFKFPPCYAVCAVGFVLYLFFNISAVWLVVFGLVSGIIICEYYERKGSGGNGNA